MLTSDDTRPKSPLKDRLITPPAADTQPVPVVRDAPDLPGPGCAVMLLLGVIALALAALMIVLSATAGWTQGSQMAQVNATETMRGQIAEQCGALPNEIANNNEVVLQARIAWLATLTPAPDCLPVYVPSATALYDRNRPTATATPTLALPPTLEATAQDAVPAEPTIAPDASSGYDLAGLLAEAEAQIATADWANAIETLDVIIRIDPEFERERVRTLMVQALNSYANFLYNSGAYAEAILVTNRAEQVGPLADGLAYEREAAQLYLNATRAVGLTYDEVIRRLRLVYDLGAGRYYTEVTQLLYEQHLAYGDALLAQGNACFAATQYGFALNYVNTPAAASKRDAANFTCQNVPPTTDPSILPTTAGGGAPLDSGTPIAPVGSRDG